MAIKKFVLWSIFTSVVTLIIHSVDSIDFHERVRWIAIGEEIREDENRGAVIEVDRYNTSIPVSTMAEIKYRTKNGKKINSIIASASKMNGYVSLENGGLEDNHVTIRYVTENGAEDDFIVFIESYRIEPFVLNDNLARAGNLAVVSNDIRNWTRDILQQAIRDDY